MNSSIGMNIVLLIVLVGVIVFVIVSTILGRKASKKEKEKRYKLVRDQIKKYISQTENRRNLRIEFEKIYGRKGSEYKYRDVFDVVVQLIEPKTNKVLEVRAYEIEGITVKIDKKNFQTDWIVNSQLDLQETKRRIAIAEKEIKLTPEEKKAMKLAERKQAKAVKEQERLLATAQKTAKKEAKATTTIERLPKNNQEKFVPIRNKNVNN